MEISRYILITQLTIIFHEKLIVLQKAYEYDTIMELEHSLICSKPPPFDPQLNQLNLIHYLTSYFSETHLKIIISSTPGSCNSSLPLQFIN
jgi:hypothetical protein